MFREAMKRIFKKILYLFRNIKMNILNLNYLIYSILNLSSVPNNSTFTRGIIQGLHISSPR